MAARRYCLPCTTVALKWFHENGVPQVLHFDESPFDEGNLPAAQEAQIEEVLALVSNSLGGEERVEAPSTAEVQDALTLFQFGQRGGIAAASAHDGSGRHAADVFVRVST